MADPRTTARDSLLKEIWDSRPGLRAPKKLWLAAIKDPAGRALVPPLTEAEVFLREWSRDEPRRQAFWRPKKEWPGRNQISNAPNVRWNADLLDWSEYTPNPAANDGYR